MVMQPHTTIQAPGITTLVLCLMLVLLVPQQTVQGQNANPPDPFGQPAAQPKPATATVKASPAPSPLPTGPPLIVRLVRESNPTTPAELTRAAKVMVETNQLQEAKQYLQRLLAIKLSTKQKADLHRQFGAALFMEFAGPAELQPEGTQIGQLISATAVQLAQDPKHISDLIAKLSDPSAEIRFLAMQDLKTIGIPAALALANLLGDKKHDAELPVIRAALRRFRSSAQEPLLGYLQSPNAAQRLEVINLLGQMNYPRSIMYLVPLAMLGDEDSLERKSAQLALARMTGTIPTQKEAEMYLRQQLDDFRQGAVPVVVDHENRITLWQWDATKKTSVPVSYRPDFAAIVLAAKTATDLYALDQQNREYQIWYLTHILGASKWVGGIDKPLSRQPGGAAELATKAGSPRVQEVYQYAIETDQIAAAIAAAEILGTIGDPDLLQAGAGQLSPLVKGLFHSNRRLRFTVMETILQLDPQASFSGASHVTEALGFFAASQGQPTAFIAHPLPVRGQFLTGLLNQAGYRTDKETSGKAFLEMVRKNADCDVVLISNTISNPTIGELIQRFRDDPRTASLSIGILASPDNLERVQLLASMDPLTEVVGRPHNVENLAFYLARLEQYKSYHRVSPDERIRQARTALQWLATLTGDLERYGFYPLFQQEAAVIKAISVPALTQHAAPVLGSLGTAKAQTALVNTASRNELDLLPRMAALHALERTLMNRRLLLTRKEILLQYDRYNASKNLDKPTQKLLASILDTIEKRMLLERSAETTKDGN